MAGFKVAYLQRELRLDAIVTEECHVGDLVIITPGATTSDPPSIARATSLAEATHIIAQSDLSLGPYEHLLTELGRYDYWDDHNVVAASKTWKPVAVYKIVDSDNITLALDGSDLKSNP